MREIVKSNEQDVKHKDARDEEVVISCFISLATFSDCGNYG